MDFTEINSRVKRGELFERIDRQNSRFRTAKSTIIKFGLHASFVELEPAKSALNEVKFEKRFTWEMQDVHHREFDKYGAAEKVLPCRPKAAKKLIAKN
ncbi:hypothetical protein TNCV_4990021 [Trichonephila clavipes]|uniref:Uncharacterized protein n=1 Tax=Trichonephila clavipes TaxID=2585209 RepID=A0A8X7BHK3_TRICX|nr:hypothetical protein TNCV_4990021 [Trichonephila clavipes]